MPIKHERTVEMLRFMYYESSFVRVKSCAVQFLLFKNQPGNKNCMRELMITVNRSPSALIPPTGNATMNQSHGILRDCNGTAGFSDDDVNVTSLLIRNGYDVNSWLRLGE